MKALDRYSLLQDNHYSGSYSECGRRWPVDVTRWNTDWLSRDLDWHGIPSFSPEDRRLARDFKNLLRSFMGSPGFLRVVTIYQTVKVGWSPCHPQTVMAKAKKAQAACSVKRSGSSHHTSEGGQIWWCPTMQSQLAASKQGVCSCLHLDNSVVCSTVIREPGGAAVSCQTVGTGLCLPRAQVSIWGSVRMNATNIQVQGDRWGFLKDCDSFLLPFPAFFFFKSFFFFLTWSWKSTFWQIWTTWPLF